MGGWPGNAHLLETHVFMELSGNIAEVKPKKEAPGIQQFNGYKLPFQNVHFGFGLEMAFVYPSRAKSE